MSWTDERVATLKKLWLEDQSAAQIARQLGGVSRNAVLGKAFRLGLCEKAKPRDSKAVQRVPPPRRSPVSKVRLSVPPSPVSKPPLVIVEARPPNDPRLKPLEQRGAGECCFPVGLPDLSRGQLYCCASTPATYCLTHARKMSAGIPKPRKPLHSDPSWRGAPKRSGVGRRFAE